MNEILYACRMHWRDQTSRAALADWFLENRQIDVITHEYYKTLSVVHLTERSYKNARRGILVEGMFPSQFKTARDIWECQVPLIPEPHKVIYANAENWLRCITLLRTHDKKLGVDPKVTEVSVKRMNAADPILAMLRSDYGSDYELSSTTSNV